MVELDLATHPDLSRKPEHTGRWFGTSALELTLSCRVRALDDRRMHPRVLIRHKAIHRHAVTKTGEFVGQIFVLQLKVFPADN